MLLPNMGQTYSNNSDGLSLFCPMWYNNAITRLEAGKIELLQCIQRRYGTQIRQEGL